MARCPAHDDRSPSLSIRPADGKVLVRCHAGCDQRDLIAALQERGLWERHGALDRFAAILAARSPSQNPISDRPEAQRGGAGDLAGIARRPRERPSQPICVARALTFRRRRALRFHRRPEASLGRRLARDGGAGDARRRRRSPIAIHRTFLARDGGGKAPVDPAKMMLGPCRGGAVRLGEPGDVLMVGEGIETCLAAMQATGNAAWAALSTSGLRSLDLPRDVRDVIVLADGDEPGEAAAQDCARRWKREGRRVRIARPPQGMDFNDLLKARNPSFTEGAR